MSGCPSEDRLRGRGGGFWYGTDTDAPTAGRRATTVDHVVPRSRGGADSWLNTVASCAEDNHRKADRTPEQAGMPLLYQPFVPSPADAMLLSLRAAERSELPLWLAGVAGAVAGLPAAQPAA